MGCDIHSVIEYKEPSGRWRTVHPGPEPVEIRNYVLFTMLADVRSEDGVPVLFEANGFPEPITDEREAWNDEAGGEHSYCHRTLAELKAAKWPGTYDADPYLAGAAREIRNRAIPMLQVAQWVGGADGPDGKRILLSDDDVRMVFNFDS